MEESKNEIRLDFRRILDLLLYKWWALLLAAVLCATAFFAYAEFWTEKQYSVSSELYVTNFADATSGTVIVTASSSDIYAANGLVATYSALVETDNTLKALKKDLSDPNSDFFTEEGHNPARAWNAEKYAYYTNGVLRNCISESVPSETQILTISVTCPDPQDAADILNCMMHILEKHYHLVGASAVPLAVVDAPRAPISNGALTKAILGFLVGFVLVAVVLVVLDLLDDTIHSDEWLKNTFGDDIPVLTVIPEVGTGKGHYGHYYYKRYGYGYYRREEPKTDTPKTETPAEKV